MNLVIIRQVGGGVLDMDYLDFSGEFSVESDGAIISQRHFDSDNDSENAQDFILRVHSSSFTSLRTSWTK